MHDKSKCIEAAERLKNGLLAKATDGAYSEIHYYEDLNILSTDNSVSKILPSFLRTCRTASDFRRMIQHKIKTYAERREYISQELKPIFDYLEKNINDTDILSNNMDAYQMGEPLGEGGFGTVFKYKHKLLDYDFAIKIFHPMPFGVDEENAEKRFFREAKILFELDHENIIRVYDIGRIEGRPFIRMEFINGYTLQDYISDKGFVSFDRSKKPIIAILNGLRYAHRKKVIHRDLKPTNVMVTTDKIKIIDFGISAYLEQENHTKLTKTGDNVASGLYTDPMLMVDPKMKDVRSDIYSVGAIWFYLLTGRAPTCDARDFLFKTNKDVTELQGSIIFKCLASDLNDRYQSCEEILKLLQSPTLENIQTNSILSNRLTEITREAIFEYLIDLHEYEAHHYMDEPPLQYQEPEKVFYYSGKRDELFFLKRLYKLENMPSVDHRFKTFEEEIQQHIINNNDYRYGWVFNDERLGLKKGNDETLLKFLCEMFHPTIRSDKAGWQNVLGHINELIREDGYETYESEKISGRAIYSYRFSV
jgi:eukaryotic-like serine/threonine-protein kinase